MTPKYLIVNADDFGASPGVNRGIIASHCRGIVTSTSLMVDTPWSAEAAAAARALPALSIGLHADLMISNGLGEPGSPATLAELSRQADRFVELVGRAPTHGDSHHNLHRDPRVLPALLEIAKRLGVPLRGHSAVRYLSSFYGQWSGESHPEQISVANLLHILASEIDGGIVELGCHPGYPDPYLSSSYAREREIEVETLCHPDLRRSIEAQGIELVSYRDLERVGSS